MVVSMTLRNTFLEVADAPKRRIRASSSPIMEDCVESCEETIVPSDDSGASGDEKMDSKAFLPSVTRSPALPPNCSPGLCPWPSTPEFLPQYKSDVEEAILTLPPCAEEEFLPGSLLDSPGLEETEPGMSWDPSWQQPVFWQEDQGYGYYESTSSMPDSSMPFYNNIGTPPAAPHEWREEAWGEQPWTDTPMPPSPLPARTPLAVPRRPPSSSSSAKTTVMLKNMPNNQTRKMLLELLDREGFRLRYDFVYLPYDFKTGATLGYAFVNFVTGDDALQAFEKFEGYCKWTVPSRKVCGVGWSEPHQGLEAHIERYRDSPVMHHDVPEKFKPLILKNGAPVPFPPPTKKLRAPRIRGLTPSE